MTKLLSTKRVCEMLAIDASTLYRRVRKGIIPAPLKDGPRSKWREEDIETYINSLDGKA